MFKIFSSILLTIALSSSIFAQDNSSRKFIPSINGPAGNYLYIVNIDDLADENFVADTDYFIIERVEKATENTAITEKDVKQIGKAQTVASYEELNEYFDTEDLDDLRAQYGNLTEQQLLDKFVNFKTQEDFPFIYSFVETRQALGHIYVDKNVQPGYFYNYNIIRVDKTGLRHDWGNAYTKGGMANYSLPNLKPKWVNAEARDSFIRINWELPLTQEKMQSLPLTAAASDENFNAVLHQLPFHYASLRAKVMVETQGGIEERGVVFPTLSAMEDTLYYEYYKFDVTDDFLKSYIVLQDEVYNIGVPSDTALVFSDDSTSATIINEIVVTDTLNGILIEWEPLPTKSYYAGIQILRHNSDDLIDTVAIIQANQTQYLDRTMEVGQYYRYHVKCLFVPQKGLEQTISAQATGTYSRFTKSLPPHNLKGETVDQYIKLDWEAVNEPSIYGYYIYRGTSPNKMGLVDGPIFKKTYTDSLEALSGRTHYFYAVAAQNLRQDTSQYSNIITIRPDKPIEIDYPSTVNIYYANGDIHLDWRDIRTQDNIVESYVLQRKIGEGGTYETLHKDILKKPSYIDKNVALGKRYFYRVASQSLYGDQSEFSSGTEYDLPKNKIATINKFFARNISEGVKISLPKMQFENRKSYNIYRRLADQQEYEKLATISASTFDYIDKNISREKYYVYTISVVETDDREGPKGKSVTVKTPKAL